jgi:small redox-active disulfide protein 2
MHIKILGKGCPNCQKVEEMARQAVAETGAKATFEKVKDVDEIKKYPILYTPGLVINDELVCAGRIPGQSEVADWVRLAMAQEAP